MDIYTILYIERTNLPHHKLSCSPVWVWIFQTHEEPILSIWILPFLPSPGAVPGGAQGNYFQSRYEEMREIGKQPNTCQRCLNRRQQPWVSGLHHLLSDVAFCCIFPKKASKSPPDLAKGSIFPVPVHRNPILWNCPQSLMDPASRINSFLLTSTLPLEMF